MFARDPMMMIFLHYRKVIRCSTALVLTKHFAAYLVDLFNLSISTFKILEFYLSHTILFKFSQLAVSSFRIEL